MRLDNQHIKDLSKFNELYGGDFDKHDYKRERKGGKQKFNYGKSRKRQRRHINKRLANREYRRVKYEW